MAVTGDNGRIHLDIGRQQLTLDTGDGSSVSQFPQGDYGWKNTVLEFRDCIRQDREPLFSGEDGMKDLAVVLKAYESAKTGEPVPLVWPINH